MKSSVFLPKTSFPMRGNLASQEPLLLQQWKNLYERKRAHRKGAPLFVLQDGPPYANGPIHLGHALNKILKDFSHRWQWLMGKDISFIPGWDCHGLPIEHQIEKEIIRKKGIRENCDPLVFRDQCKAYAAQWIDNQKKDFQRLGIIADWDGMYSTMDLRFEARILHHFFRLLKKGFIYRGLKPVLWSASEKTALAEAEVDYLPKVSKALYVRFPFTSGEFAGASAVIWTTTPWSLPGNRALAYCPSSSYGLYEVEDIAENSLCCKGEKLIVACDRWEAFSSEVGIEKANLLKVFEGSTFQKETVCHPWAKEGYNEPVPLLPSEYVTLTMGTGLVHTAPSHGVEDFILGQRHGLTLECPLLEDGRFSPTTPLVGGLLMEEAYSLIKEALLRNGTLLKEEDYSHSYPHSWRSKKPLFYRATPQWFMRVDSDMKNQALAAIQKVTWFPETSQNRMEAMMHTCPDWCLSRQRLWGVPIALFMHKETNDILKDASVFERIEERVQKEGVDFWFTDEAYSVLGKDYDPKEWNKSSDILDVWLESGLVHEIILQDKLFGEGPLAWPASLYLEGSDQHRAYFQVSLKTSLALHQGKAPYEAVLTHGFVLDEQGQKMSKSLSNVVAPQDIISTRGADIVRLWTAYEDFRKDLKIGPSILDRVEDVYRRFRNTFRYLLGALDGFYSSEIQPLSSMGILEKWMHHSLWQCHHDLMKDLQSYDFQAMIARLHLFCNQDLSSFYFDVCKDSLYCDASSSLQRQGIRTTFFHTFLCLVHWLSPFLCFTTEEAWQCFFKDILHGKKESLFGLKNNFCETIHLSDLPIIPQEWKNPEVLHEIEGLRMLRTAVTPTLEKAREKKEMGTSLQACVHLYVSHEFCTRFPLLSWDLLPSIFLVSEVVVHKGESLPHDQGNRDIGVVVEKAKGQKCYRCWRVLQEVTEEGCKRCCEVEKFLKVCNESL